ncbi:hypothetical protein [Actinokineospora diospyrosa]|uniref:Secreted protein with PEP-CTERM sorting signal n=1 Tax=Actinokineospora diospyrosa TaxID=103728 RepID=A0ABT1IFS4_9PSEU|nr:hypothetical protein [Actinokineospora diospyrosa]MCP2271401.1 hypothetical protein [Actinokineospora diospyrosa]
MTAGSSAAPAVVVGVVAVVAVALLVWGWRASARRAREAALRAEVVGGPVSLVGRTVVGALVIAGVQWLVLTHPAATGWARVAALGVPALFASWSLVRAVSGGGVHERRQRRGRR